MRVQQRRTGTQPVAIAGTISASSVRRSYTACNYLAVPCVVSRSMTVLVRINKNVCVVSQKLSYTRDRCTFGKRAANIHCIHSNQPQEELRLVPKACMVRGATYSAGRGGGSLFRTYNIHSYSIFNGHQNIWAGILTIDPRLPLIGATVYARSPPSCQGPEQSHSCSMCLMFPQADDTRRV